MLIVWRKRCVPLHCVWRSKCSSSHENTLSVKPVVDAWVSLLDGSSSVCDRGDYSPILLAAAAWVG